MKKVQILLSTYNGEKFIKQQLDSILKQSYQNCRILVRDDGSTDGTIKILQHYKEENSCLDYYIGKNVGSMRSFFDLMKHADSSADYYAFSDQDDVWLEGKVARAVEKLEDAGKKVSKENEEKLLYCSAFQLVDENLEPLPAGITYKHITPAFGNSLVENICTGCTCVLNRQLFIDIVEHIPEFAIMHDFWFYLVASCYGKVIYDDQPYILYRQHAGNVLGAASSVLSSYRRRIRNFKKHRFQLSRQAKEFQRIYHAEGAKGRLINEFIQSKDKIGLRFKLSMNKDIYRQRSIDNICMRLFMLVGII